MAISAHVGHFSPAPPPPPPRPRVPYASQAGPASTPTRARTSPSLSVPWASLVGVVLSRAPVLSLSVPPSPPVSLSLTSRPQSPRRGRAHDRAFSGHVRAPAPLLSPAPCSPTSPLSFAPSAQLPRPSLSLCLRKLRAPPPPVDAHRLFCGRRCARAPSSATVSFALPSAARDTLRCALSLPATPGPCSPGCFLAQPESATAAPSSLCASAVAS
jgi:hypothetical protein